MQISVIDCWFVNQVLVVVLCMVLTSDFVMPMSRSRKHHEYRSLVLHTTTISYPLFHALEIMYSLKKQHEGQTSGLHIRTKSSHTLTGIGRNGDTIVEGKMILRVHCRFAIHEDSGEILYYRSSFRSTQTFGSNAVPLELERPKRGLVVATQEQFRLPESVAKYDLD